MDIDNYPVVGIGRGRRNTEEKEICYNTAEAFGRWTVLLGDAKLYVLGRVLRGRKKH